MKHAESRKKPDKRHVAVLDVLIAHDQEIIRLGLKAVIEDYPNLRVCGEASSAAETAKKVKMLRPRILMLKHGLPGQTASETIPELLKLRTGLRILLLAAEGPIPDTHRAVLTPAMAKRALHDGAQGLVLKPDAQDIRFAIYALSNNKSFVSPNILVDIADPSERKQPENLHSVGDLTAREMEVLKRMAMGKTTKEIAAELLNSPRTIDVHRANMMHKLGLHTQADLIFFALKHHLIPLPPTSGNKH